MYSYLDLALYFFTRIWSDCRLVFLKQLRTFLYFVIAVLQSSFFYGIVLFIRGRLDFPIAIIAAFIISDDNLLISSLKLVWFMFGVYSLGRSNWFYVIY